MPGTATTSVKLDAETRERVKRLAALRRRSAHWVMREAIEEYVAREEKREQFRQEALARWNEYRASGRHVSEADADVWLAQLEAGEDADLPG